ncbi:MAG: Spy/CpxP family protein refolding chaperone [Caulobacter sp.]|nr:Spy/CpxP family protein refolding chaperone [Caulobacter sp.]
MTYVFSKAFLLAGAMALGSVSIAVAAPAAAPASPEAKVEKRVVIKRGGDGPGRGWHRDPAKHAQHLRDVLQLTAAQEPALQAFLAATMPPMHSAHPGPDGDKAERKALTTPERLDRQAEMMARHHAAFEKRAAATRAFYGQLSASQKKAFDALPMMHGPRMMRGPGGMGGERRVKVIRGASGPGGEMTWQTQDGMDEEVIMLGDLGEDMAYEFMIAPPAPPAPPAPRR